MMGLKKYFSFFILILALSISGPTFAAGGATSLEDSTGLMDDSIRDISVVMGTGAVGALLGLSTLSFVQTPSDHWKNVAIGGAVGIVIGVGVVIFSAATRSTSAMTQAKNEVPLNSDKFVTLTRHDFINVKIAQNYLKQPSLGYNFSF